jgi:hypothetical protein
MLQSQLFHRQCIACKRWFSQSGYTRHIRLTKQPQCRAVYDAQLSNLPDISSDVEMDTQPQPFEGDFYGPDYVEEDFMWDDDTGSSHASGVALLFKFGDRANPLLQTTMRQDPPKMVTMNTVMVTLMMNIKMSM